MNDVIKTRPEVLKAWILWCQDFQRPGPQCRLLSDDNSSKFQRTAAAFAILWLGGLASRPNLQFFISLLFQTPKDDYDDEKVNLEKGVDEAVDENGTKGENKDSL